MKYLQEICWADRKKRDSERNYTQQEIIRNLGIRNRKDMYKSRKIIQNFFKQSGYF